MNRRRASLVCAVALWLAACTTFGGTIDGRWTLTLTGGEVERLTIKSLGNGDWYLSGGASPLAGVYRSEAGELRMLKPDNPRAAGFVLRHDARGFYIVAQAPAPTLVQRKYMGAELRREAAESE